MNIIKASLKYKAVTLSVLLLLFAVGVNSLLTMPRREDPKITIRQGLVIAFFPGANSAQVNGRLISTSPYQDFLPYIIVALKSSRARPLVKLALMST